MSHPRGEERVVSLSAGPIRLRDRGEGEPIVFVHGVLMNGDAWNPVVPLLAERYRCLTPDWPTGGHGLPLDARATLTIPALADLVVELLAALDVRPTLVGIGLGTVLCEMVAIRSPDRVARVVFANGDILSTFPPRWARLRFSLAYAPPLAAAAARMLQLRRVRWLAFRRFAHSVDDELWRSFTRGIARDPAIRRDTLKLMRAICRGRTETVHEALRAFRRPVLIVWGQDDRAFPPSHPRDLAGVLPGRRVETIAGARTFLAQDQPARFAAAIADFMATTPGDAP